MERSERSSTGKTAATPAAPGHAAPGRSTAVGEGMAPPPEDPEDLEDLDDEALDDDEYEDDEDEPVRAEPWQPDASLMRALGLELGELRVRLEAGDRDGSDDAPALERSLRTEGGGRPARAAGCEAGAEADAELVPAEEPAEERTPWW
jgi:hypothetical protein